MRNPRTTFLAVLAFLLLLVAFPVHALSNRVFVSTTGNDANDCSNPLTPCVDFTGALAQVATGGEVIAQATGPYGPLSITKSVTISGPPGVVIYSGHQVTVNAPTAVVVLRGLTIDGNGAAEFGIGVQAVGTLQIEGCVIANFADDGINVTLATNGDILVSDTTVRGCNHGLLVQASGGTPRVNINRCRFDKNSRGIEADAGAVTVRDTTAADNLNIGLGAFFDARMWIENCVVTGSSFGIAANQPMGAGYIVRISNSTVANNTLGIDNVSTGVVATRSNNTLIDNGSPTFGTITTFSTF